jgi:IclR family pca regulon transcriptional regulator
MRSSKDDRDFVQALARGLAVLQSFGDGSPTMTLAEVARRVSLSRGTVRRLLMTLQKLGHVGSDGKHFWLTPQVMDLGYRYLSSLPWWRSAQPILEETADAVSESCNVAVLEGTEVIFLAGVATARIVSMKLTIGSRLPAYATSTGKVLLSAHTEDQLKSYFASTSLKPLTPRTITDPRALRRALARAATDGYALSDEELELGLRSIAVPILDRSGRMAAAMSISSQTHRLTLKQVIHRHLPVLRKAATKIAQAIP